MKTVTFKSFALILLSVFFFAFSAEAQPKLRVKARKVIHRTAPVIHHAHKVVKEHKVYTGNLAKAVRHQRFARKLFVTGQYKRAIYHSRRARHLAIMAIKANKQSVKAEWEFDKEENNLGKGAPVDADLDKQLDNEMPGSSKDEDFMQDALQDVDVEDIKGE